MNTKTYSVRIPQSAPDLSSEQVSTWLLEHTDSTAALALDPGAGPRVLRLTLDRAKVEQNAQAAGETDAVFLRRLIATRANVAPEGQESELEKETAEKPRPRPMILPLRLRLSAEQMAPAVAAFDHFQAFAISRAMKTPEALVAARLNEEERTQLATATAELANRRAPAWLVENIDIFGFASLIVSIEFKKIDAAREVARRARGLQAPQQKEQPNGEAASGGLDVVSK